MEWSKTYCGAYGVVVQTSDSGYAIGGANASALFYPAAERAAALTKVDSSGVLQWRKTYEVTGLTFTDTVLQTTDGGYLLSGSRIFGSSMNVNYNGWIIKTDGNGNFEWNSTVTQSIERGCTIQTSDGYFIFAGYAANSFGGADGVLVKLDANGKLLWIKVWGENSTSVMPMAVTEADGQGYFIGGIWDHSGWLAKTDVNGNLVWSKTFQYGSDDCMINGASNKSDGGCILAGVDENNRQAWLVDTDSNGNRVWGRTYDLKATTILWSAVQILDGSFVAVGGTIEKSGERGVVLKTDSSGNLQYQNFYGDSNGKAASAVSSVYATRDGGYAIAGNLNEQTIGNSTLTQPIVGNNTWLAKFSPNDLNVNATPSVPEFPLVSTVGAMSLIVVATAGIIIRRKFSLNAQE